MKYLLFTIIFCSFLPGCGRTQTSGSNINIVLIDKQIKDSIEARTIEIDGILFGSINFRLIGNDSLVLEHQTFDLNSYAKNMSFLNEDTLKTVGYLTFGNLGIGYVVLLSNKATCKIDFAIISELESLKLMKEDPPSQSLIVSCVSSELSIPSKPKFAKGEIIYGKVNLISSDFYDVEKDTEIKYRIELTGYFKTEVY